jgi:hypothetical protein
MRVWPQALPPDQVVPGVTGEVLFVWQRPGVLVEAEIADSNHIEWLVAVDGLPSRCWQTNLDETWLVALIPHVLRSANGMAPP